MPDLNVSTLLLFAAFVVPGAVSLQIYKLKVSTGDQPLKENLVEGIVFSIVNFALLYWPILYAISPDTMTNRAISGYIILLTCFFVAPAVWPFLLYKVLRIMERKQWIQPRAKSGWDHYFNNLESGCYIVVHLNDGSCVGGKFDQGSYASGYPSSGHIFIEELWEVRPDGTFTGRPLKGQGVILRPSDYKYIRVST